MSELPSPETVKDIAEQLMRGGPRTSLTTLRMARTALLAQLSALSTAQAQIEGLRSVLQQVLVILPRVMAQNDPYAIKSIVDAALSHTEGHGR